MNQDKGNVRASSFWKENWINVVVIGLLVATLLWMLWLMSSPTRTPVEASLEAFVLTACSIIVSWLVTKLYAVQTASQSLRDYGVQVASGMLVLKSQIIVLTDWVSSKRASFVGAGASPVFDGALEHIEETLRGFRGQTDAALAGIGGVIGDALNQYESVMERIGTIRSDASEKKQQLESQMVSAASNEEIDRLRVEIGRLSEQTELQVAKLARSSTLPIPEAPSRRQFVLACPQCTREVHGEILDKPGETKAARCSNCGGTFNVHVSQFGLMTRAIPNSPQKSIASPDTQALIIARLKDLNSWLNPKDLVALVEAVVRAHSTEASVGQSLSPAELQERLFIDQVLIGRVPRQQIRRFISILFSSRFFQFDEGIPDNAFRAKYRNQPTPRDLVVAWVSAMAARVRSAEPPIAATSSLIIDTVLGGEFGKEIVDAVDEVLKHDVGSPRRSGGVPGQRDPNKAA